METKSGVPIMILLSSSKLSILSESLSKVTLSDKLASINSNIICIFISSANAEKLYNKRILVRVGSWDVNSYFPTGHCIDILGNVGELAVETKAILHQGNISEIPFSSLSLNELPNENYSIPADEFENRLDLRFNNVFSIDPPSCVDIDDTLSLRYLPNGNYHVGVHIADVSHFVKPNSYLDREAQKRCTTVYMINKRIDMLPNLLSSDLCSLRSGLDRLTFSIFWEITPAGEIVSTNFHKSIIHSVAALDYKQAQELIDKNDESVIGVRLRDLMKISKIWRKARQNRGALELRSVQLEFEFDQDSYASIKTFHNHEIMDTNNLIEEFMLQANISVSQKLLECFPQCTLLRCHPDAIDNRLLELQTLLKNLGVTFKCSNSKELTESLDYITKKWPHLDHIVRQITVFCMNRAKYISTTCVKDPTKYYHYALATTSYTHFTSPIRRYADIIVHRLLAAALQIASLPRTLAQQLETMTKRMNQKHEAANVHLFAMPFTYYFNTVAHDKNFYN
uniref:Exosome complex exonuclease RRP44 homolog A-like n=1 Tax=Dermatophagoides pteronyssinus TaxID=6956 RepID=A0A6P6XLH2_DERPT|nr:exosome complex exonuclease RRP44 homolog A-like [Dermatophagoides pteronyssinus]